ncbi:MAG: hypothetical protein ABTQ31_15095 [Rhizobiaceae bacterium]
MKAAPEGLFKPKPTSSQAKGEMTTRVARSIIEGEVSQRDAKTARLRAMRLAREAEIAAAPPPAKPAPARRSRKA